MRAIVFSGPTLSHEEVERRIDEVTCLPPVSQGDVYRVSLERPWAIGIIDGYFQRVPAVWHKEILWAMSQGIHIFGAASMGALRAAELANFGMVGVGDIFELFHAGTLTDDDEVAVLHGPAESGFKTLTEPMVNIRVTLAKAGAEGVIDEVAQEALSRVAKGLFYGHRTYERILEEVAVAGRHGAAVERLRAWLPRGRIDQKARDAVAMLRSIQALRETSPGPFQARFHFEHTDMWEQVGCRMGRRRLETGSENAQRDTLFDEIRLLGAERYTEILKTAFGHAVGLEEARRHGVKPVGEQIEEEMLRFRGARGLRSTESMSDWLAEQRLSIEDFEQLMESRLRLEQVRQLFAPETLDQVRQVLRLQGDYGCLLDRALSKQRLLADHGYQSPDLGGSRLTASEVLDWYFTEVLQQPVPADVDAYALELGCSSREDFLQVLLREWWYLQLQARAVSPSDC
ncbi:MAG: TfuA-like protein [Acidobacteriota bacterium]